jgi:glycyl-tRNA synthetase (class II)
MPQPSAGSSRVNMQMLMYQHYQQSSAELDPSVLRLTPQWAAAQAAVVRLPLFRFK